MCTTHNARIDESFEGNFSLKFDASVPYTHHSHNLKDVTLTGDKDSGVVVNQYDNNITGNKGTNTAFFSGIESEYTVTQDGDKQIVTDNVDNRDGVNTLMSIEKLKFATTEQAEKRKRFNYISEQTNDVIAVYGSNKASKVAYTRAYYDIQQTMNKMDANIKQSLLKSGAKILVVSGEQELVDDIEYFSSLLPVEAIFTSAEGVDETLPVAKNGNLSATKLELMYLTVYYAMLEDDSLAAQFQELKDAYQQAADGGFFTPGEAYQDGYEDPIHQNASKQNALKYGSYLFNLYMIYNGDNSQDAGEFSFTTREELGKNNPLGMVFMQKYYDIR